MIYTVTWNPGVDKTVVVPNFAPGAVNRIVSMRVDAGGKGVNVSRWIRALGGRSVAMGFLGGGAGDFILETLKAEGIEADFVRVDAETRTNVKIIDPLSHAQTDLNEPGAPVPEAAFTDLMDRLRARVCAGDVVVLSGRLTPGAPSDLPARWIVALNALGARVFLDADGEALRLGIAACPRLVKPNEGEFAALAGEEALTSPEALAAAAIRLNLPRVVVSLGARGALFAEGGRAIFAEGLKVCVGSTAGAGDAMVAALALSEAKGEESLVSAIPTAMAAGAASAMQPGTQTAPLETVQALSAQVRWREV